MLLGGLGCQGWGGGQGETTNQRNLRPVVSVGVSTECARLEYEGHHANSKNGCDIFKQNLSHLWIGDLKVFCT